MLQNAYLLAKIGADTAENERKFAEILPKICNFPSGPAPPTLVDGAAARRARGRPALPHLESGSRFFALRGRGPRRVSRALVAGPPVGEICGSLSFEGVLEMRPGGSA